MLFKNEKSELEIKLPQLLEVPQNQKLRGTSQGSASTRADSDCMTLPVIDAKEPAKSRNASTRQSYKSVTSPSSALVSAGRDQQIVLDFQSIPVLSKEYQRESRMDRERRQLRQKAHEQSRQACLRKDRQVTLKCRVESRKSQRSLQRLDSSIEKSKAVLAIFPSWQKEFKSLCRQREQEQPEI